MGRSSLSSVFLLPLLISSPVFASEEQKESNSPSSRQAKQLQFNQDHFSQVPFYPRDPTPPQHQSRFYMSQPQISYPYTTFTSPPVYQYQQQQGPTLYSHPNANAQMMNYMPVNNPYNHISSSPPPFFYQTFDPYMLMMGVQNQQAPQHANKYQGSLVPQNSQQLQAILAKPGNPQFLSSSPNGGATPFFGSGNSGGSKLPSRPGGLMSNLAASSQIGLPSTLSLPSSSSSEPSSNMIFPQSESSPHSFSSSSPVSSLFANLSPDAQKLLASLLSAQTNFPSETKTRNTPSTVELHEMFTNPPPKAIMTTAMDILDPSFYQMNPMKSLASSSSPSTLMRNNMPVYHTRNVSDFDFPGGLSLNVPSAPVPIKEESDDFPNFEEICEDCKTSQQISNEIPSSYVSEPIVPGTKNASPSDDMIKAIIQKTKKESHIAHHDQAAQPHNFQETDELIFQDLTVDADPIPLFATGDDDGDSSFGHKDTTIPEDVKRRVYQCPQSRDLRELNAAEIFADPLKCDQFYYCKWGRAYVFKCPPNTVFNVYTKVCENDEDFACANMINKK